MTRRWEPAPPDPGVIPGGIRDRALRALWQSKTRTPTTDMSDAATRKAATYTEDEAREEAAATATTQDSE